MKLEQRRAQPVIETPRCTLRPLRIGDAPLLQQHAGDKRVAQTTNSLRHPFPPGAAEAAIVRAAAPTRKEDTWAIDATKSGGAELIGIMALTRHPGAVSELGYFVEPKLWNTGLASEAVAAICEANPQGASEFMAMVFQCNPASARVLTKHGFAFQSKDNRFSKARGVVVPIATYTRKADQ